MLRASQVGILVVGALVGLVPSAARADDEAIARAHYASGRAYYEQGRYEDALREFQEAFDAAPEDSQKGLMIFNVAQAQERLGRIGDAVASFQRYLVLVPAAEDRATVEQRIQTLQARLADTGIDVVASVEGAHVFVDGAASGTTPLAAPLRVPPGSHELRVEKDGFRPFRLRVSVEAGRVVRTEVTLVAIPEEGSRLSLLPWIVGGVGVVGIISGTVFGILALGEADAANEDAAGDFERWDEASSNAETLALVADISFGVAIAAGVGTLVLFLIAPSSDDEASAATTRLHLSPVLGTRGAGLVLGGEL